MCLRVSAALFCFDYIAFADNLLHDESVLRARRDHLYRVLPLFSSLSSTKNARRCFSSVVQCIIIMRNSSTSRCRSNTKTHEIYTKRMSCVARERQSKVEAWLDYTDEQQQQQPQQQMRNNTIIILHTRWVSESYMRDSNAHNTQVFCSSHSLFLYFSSFSHSRCVSDYQVRNESSSAQMNRTSTMQSFWLRNRSYKLP